MRLLATASLIGALAALVWAAGAPVSLPSSGCGAGDLPTDGWQSLPASEAVAVWFPSRRPVERSLPAEEIIAVVPRGTLRRLLARAGLQLDMAGLGARWRGIEDDVLLLEIMAGGEPVVELTDMDLDGNVDVVRVFDAEAAVHHRRDDTAELR